MPKQYPTKALANILKMKEMAKFILFSQSFTLSVPSRIDLWLALNHQLLFTPIDILCHIDILSILDTQHTLFMFLFDIFRLILIKRTIHFILYVHRPKFYIEPYSQSALRNHYKSHVYIYDHTPRDPNCTDLLTTLLQYREGSFWGYWGLQLVMMA